MTPEDYKKLFDDLRIVVKYARDGIGRDDKEYKDICLRLIRHYVLAEVLLEDVEEDDWNCISSLKMDLGGAEQIVSIPKQDELLYW